MKILLIGEYSNVHTTLAKGLRALGHQVCVMSDGDSWKNYPRDIDVARQAGKIGGIKLLAKVYSLLSKLKGYDIVQLINPMFLELKAERLFRIYRYLRKHNKRVVLGAFGMDWYWVHECTTTMPLRYSDFNIGKELRTNDDALKERKDWLGTAKEKLNKMIAEDCDAIVSGLYEYQVCYQTAFPAKTTFIPYPIVPKEQKLYKIPHPLKIFTGISKSRSEYKGTDIMLQAAKNIAEKYPDLISLQIAEGVPFKQYVSMMQECDVILDQLYSYTPAMNALEAMSQGIVVIGGGEPENYEILHETELHPIINVLPNYESVYHELEELVLHPERLPELKRQSVAYIQKHHEHIKVARQYEQLYQRIL